MDLVIGIDTSTTATKAVAFDANGRVVHVGRAPMSRSSPRATWHEQHAADWWTSTVAALGQVVAAARDAGDAIVAIGVTHQRESFVLLDERHEPVRPAILWLDARAGEQVRRLGTHRVHAISGKPPSTTPSLYKLAWLAEHEPAAVARARWVADVHAYLSLQLTGRFATSLASADPTGLVDMGTSAWSPELIGLVGLDEGMLPEIVAPGARIGGVSAAAAAATGLVAGTPVIAGAGDGQSGGLGVGVARSGRAYLSLGTSITLGAHAADGAIPATSYRVLGSPLGEGVTIEAFIATGALSVSWIRSALEGALPADATELDALVAQVPAGARGLRFLPYLSGAATPYWDDRARGAFVGIDESHDAATLARAVLEGLAFEILLLLEGLEVATGPIDEIVVTGGGIASSTWLQIIADAIQRPLLVSSTTEATALGAAILAASSVGLTPGGLADVADRMTAFERRVEPDAAAPYERAARGYREVYPALRALFQAGHAGA